MLRAVLPKAGNREEKHNFPTKKGRRRESIWAPMKRGLQSSPLTGSQGRGALRQVLLRSHLFSTELAQPMCRTRDEGISHLKTQINYSFPANEQPLGSCGSRKALRILLATALSRADAGSRRRPVSAALAGSCPRCGPFRVRG